MSEVGGLSVRGGSEAVVRFPRVANNAALFVFYVVGGH